MVQVPYQIHVKNGKNLLFLRWVIMLLEKDIIFKDLKLFHFFHRQLESNSTMESSERIIVDSSLRNVHKTSRAPDQNTRFVARQQWESSVFMGLTAQGDFGQGKTGVGAGKKR